MTDQTEKVVSVKDTAKEWIIAIVVAIVIAVIVRGFLYEPYRVSGPSMMPTFQGDELLVVNAWIYHVENPKYGDIVIFNSHEGGRDFIKRVIGLPGDKIAIHDGHVYRNGVMLKEPYIREPMVRDDYHPEITIPANCIYAMGDNRNNSYDSRNIGPVKMGDIVGRADVIVFPLSHANVLAIH